MTDICNDEFKGNACIYNFTFIQQQEEPTEEAIVYIDGYYDDEDNVQIVTLVCHSEDNQDTIHDYTINTNLLEEAFAVEDGDLESCIVNLLPVKVNIKIRNNNIETIRLL